MVASTGEPPPGLQQAVAYLEVLLASPEYTREAIPPAVAAGDELLEAAGGWKEAGEALRQAGRLRFGNHFEGLFDSKLDGLIDKLLVEYVRKVAAEGVPARHQGPRFGMSSKPHASAANYMDEVMADLWKDARKGRIILCSDSHSDLIRDVTRVPMGRVPKMNPD